MEYFRSEFVIYYSEEVYRKYPLEMIEAQYTEEYEIAGNTYPRIRYGDEQYPGGMRHTKERCGDCNVKLGEYHVFGCDWELCPKCLGQSISCYCDHTEEEETAEQVS